MQLIVTHNENDCIKHLVDYRGVFSELSVFDGLVIRGAQIIIPRALQADMIGLAHEGHQYVDKTLRLLRESYWFPRMRKHVDSYVQSCIACNSAINRNAPAPLEPNFLPARTHWRSILFTYRD